MTVFAPLLIVITTCFYLPVVTQAYLYSDDHLIFTDSLFGRLEVLSNYFLRDGRPLSAILLPLTINWVDDYAGFQFLRFIALLGALAFALHLYGMARRVFVNPYFPALFSLLVVTSPSFAIYVGWGSCYLFPFSAVLALWAAELVLRAGSSASRSRILFMIGLGILLLVASFSIYQITTLFFMVPFTMEYFRRYREGAGLKEPRENLRLITFPLITGLAGSALYLAITMYLKKVAFAGEEIVNERGIARLPDGEVIGGQLNASLERVFPGWLSLALPGWGMVIGLILAAGVLLLLATSIKRGFRGDNASAIFWLACCLASCLLPVLALFVADQDSLPWRLFSVTHASFLFLLFALVENEILSRSGRRGSFFIWAIITLFAVAQLSSGAWNFREGFVKPNARETREFVPLAKAYPPGNYDLYIFGLPAWSHFTDPRKSYEYTYASAGLESWFARTAIPSLLASVHGRSALKDRSIDKFNVVNVSVPVPVNDQVAALTVEEYFGPRYAAPAYKDVAPLISVPSLGEVRKLSEYVYYSDQLGYLLDWSGSWYYNPTLQFIRPEARSGNEIICHSHTLGRIRIPVEAPLQRIWVEKEGRWFGIEELAGRD